LQNLESSVPYPHQSGQTGHVPGLTFIASLRMALVVVACAVLASCAGTRGGPIPYNPQNFVAPDAPTTVGLEEDYKIAPLDTLHISVFQVADLTNDYDVDLTGTISLPLIGSVKAVDLTTKQLDERITERLSEKYLQHPDVSVAVKASSTRIVTVDGAVKQAGVFPVTGRLTLLQVIALAHGTDTDANPHRVAVFRTIQGQRMAAAFDLTSIRRGQAEDPRIYSGDIVVVDGSKIKGTWQNILQTLPILAIFHPFGI
jgi:polysaccharide export outer membrane protein